MQTSVTKISPFISYAMTQQTHVLRSLSYLCPILAVSILDRSSMLIVSSFMKYTLVFKMLLNFNFLYYLDMGTYM